MRTFLGATAFGLLIGLSSGCTAPTSSTGRGATSFPNAPDDKRDITVAQLLNHRAGLADIIDAEGRAIAYSTAWDYLPVDRASMEHRILKSTLLFEPGSDRRYSNAGYSLLAAIIERASGQTYEAFVRRYVFAGPKCAAQVHACRLQDVQHPRRVCGRGKRHL